MLVLFETPAGFALFNLKDEGVLKKINEKDYFSSPEEAKKVVSLKAFHKFENTKDAMIAATSLIESKLPDSLSNFLKENIKKEKIKLGVCDKSLASNIQDKLKIQCFFSTEILDLMRGIRTQLATLLEKVSSEKDLANMSIGLSHSLSRYKLKFSPDKVDTMIVQAISLLDDLDKELNTYSMRVKEWYGWHFPELAKIIVDNSLFAKCVLKIKNRNVIDIEKLDLSDILTEDLEEAVKKQLKISMGTEISEEDIEHISLLCIEVIGIAEYRGKLFNYLTNRMQAIAPNLTHLVGELVGARLIAHAGSLINLAKAPSSTLQILGAEKALFRALKSKSNTPKYGLIYHASLIGQAPSKHKGKIARVLAAKCSISSRVDALGENEKITIGLKSKEKVEDRLKNLDTLSSKKYVSTKVQKLDKSKTLDRSSSFPSKIKSKEENYNEKNDVTSNKRKREDEEEKKEVKKPKLEEKKEEKKEVKKESSSDSDSDSDSSSDSE